MGGKRYTVTVKLTGMKKAQQALQADLRLSSNGPIREAMRDWVAIMGRFLTRRYLTFSLGGGDWAPLKPATLVAKARAGLLPFILRATDLMFEAFAPAFNGKPAPAGKDVPFGVRVSFGGGMHQLYPGTTTTVAEVAMYHQRGGGTLPSRKTIVPPDAATKKEMRDRMQEAVDQQWSNKFSPSSRRRIG